MLTNAYVGIRGADPDAVDAARGMGMSGWQVLRRVELPLAVPLIMAGVRLAAVQVVATATIAALVAGGGLGMLITAGFGVQDQAELLAGAVCVGGARALCRGREALLQRWVDPMRSPVAGAGRHRRIGKPRDPVRSSP